MKRYGTIKSNRNRIRFLETPRAKSMYEALKHKSPAELKTDEFVKWYIKTKQRSEELNNRTKEAAEKKRFTRVFFTLAIGVSMLLDGLLVFLITNGVNPTTLVIITIISGQLKVWGGAVFSKVFL